MEGQVSRAVVEDLAKKGHAQVIMTSNENGALHGGADPRVEGVAPGQLYLQTH